MSGFVTPRGKFFCRAIFCGFLARFRGPIGFIEGGPPTPVAPKPGSEPPSKTCEGVVDSGVCINNLADAHRAVRRCCQCLEDKPLADFRRRLARQEARMTLCRACHAASEQRRRQSKRS